MKIIQVIPLAHPIVAVHGSEGKIDDIRNVDYLALADDGEIYGLNLIEGRYNLCDESNFIGLCEIGGLFRFLEDNGLAKLSTFGREEQKHEEK